MKEQFSDDYFFIKDVIHYLRNGNNAQKAEYADKLLNRYEKYIKAVIAKGIKIEYQLKDEVFNQFCMKLFDPDELDKYRGDASFMTFIYPRILEAIRIVMTPSEEERKEKENQKRKNKKAGKCDEGPPVQYTQEAAVSNILREDLETSYPTRQHSQEDQIAINELRSKLDHAIAISLLNLSKVNPQDARILVMKLSNLSWDEIAQHMDTEVNSTRRRYSRHSGIEDKFSELLLKTLWDSYKIDFSIISKNIGGILDIE